MKIDPYRIFLFLGTVWGLTFVLFMVDNNLTDPNKFVESDYVTNFYVAGHLVASGQASILYSGPNDNSLWGSPFDNAAHALLFHLPKDAPAVFRYSPLVAWIFAPLSQFRPNISLLVWQGISIVALIISSLFLSRTTDVKASDIVFLSALFFPVMINLWAGQVSLVLGLLPLSAGYFLFSQGRPFIAGLIWSFLALKPQLFPAAILVGIAQVFAGRLECFAGLTVGVLGLAAANLALVPLTVILNWLSSLKLSDTVFLSGSYKIPSHLITSLPSNLVISLPIEWRPTLKLPLYSAAGFLWLTGLWESNKIVKSKLDEFSKVSLPLVIGLLLVPLSSPHLMYYDLAVLIPAGLILIRSDSRLSQLASLKPAGLIGWISISIYMLIFLNAPFHAEFPLVLTLIFLILFVVLLRRVHEICTTTGPV